MAVKIINGSTEMMQRLNGNRFNRKILPKYIACLIFVQGNERRKDERFAEARKLRNAFKKASDHFQVTHPSDPAPNTAVLEFLSAHFLFTRKYHHIIAAHFERLWRICCWQREGISYDRARWRCSFGPIEERIGTLVFRTHVPSAFCPMDCLFCYYFQLLRQMKRLISQHPWCLLHSNGWSFSSAMKHHQEAQPLYGGRDIQICRAWGRA